MLFSRCVRTVAWPLLVVLMATTLGPSLHATDAHDTDCDPALFAHDPGQHRVTADEREGLDGLAQHCAVCHALRLVRLSAPIRITASAPIARVRLGEITSAPPPSAPVLPLPARAPPSLT